MSIKIEKYSGIYISYDLVKEMTYSLTPNEKAVYLALCMLLQEKGSIYIWTSAKHLSSIANLSTPTTLNALKGLIRAGFIHRDTKYFKKDTKFQAKSIYRILKVQLA